MILFALTESDVAAVGGVLSFLYLVLVLLILLLVRSLDMKLMSLGILTGLLAAWCAFLSGGAGASVQVMPAAAGATGRIAVAGEATAVLGRLAVLLTLGGLACVAVGRWSLFTTATREDPRRDNSV
jgi:hypothetical protein